MFYCEESHAQDQPLKTRSRRSMERSQAGTAVTGSRPGFGLTGFGLCASSRQIKLLLALVKALYIYI